MRVNGAVPTTIIVVGLALAAYALLMTAMNKRTGGVLLAWLLLLEILLLVLVGLIVAKLAGGARPSSLPTLIGYLIATPLVPLIAGFWGAAGAVTLGPGRHRCGRRDRGHPGRPAARGLGGGPV